MGKIFDFVFKRLDKNDGGYNVSSGAIYHPPKGKGKSPKVKSKMVKRQNGDK